jgi:two-component system alkaline phosphatase synthesis response regulator PhoP
MTPSGRRVLIVEDDHNILISLKFLLENAGYDVLTASDGVRGWAALEEHQPDLAVFDIMLPALDGYELCRRVRASPKLQTMKILILSARGLDAEVAKGLQMGADAYLRKPFGTREFLETVGLLLVQTPYQ